MRGECGVEKHGHRYVWLYGHCQRDIEYMLDRQIASGNTVLGYSLFAEDSAFPLAGLAQAMQEAIQGKLDELILSDYEILNGNTQGQAIIENFQSYGVVVKSANRNGSRSS